MEVLGRAVFLNDIIPPTVFMTFFRIFLIHVIKLQIATSSSLTQALRLAVEIKSQTVIRKFYYHYLGRWWLPDECVLS